MVTHRLAVLDALAKNPPFTRRSPSPLNTLPLAERLWNTIWYVINYSVGNVTDYNSTKLPSDILLRNAAVEVYSALYGRLTPSCVPQGVRGQITVVINSY